MLDVLLKEDIHNTAVVVTRYFGGTLLGTGGLVRAYSKAVQEGLRNSVIIEKQEGILLTIETDYNGLGKIQYLLGQKGYVTVDSSYTDTVSIQVLVPAQEEAGLEADLTEATNGKAEFSQRKPVIFAMIGKTPKIFS